MKKILMVLTSHDKLGDTGKATGFWLEEFTTPYYVFRDAGAQITLASPLCGQPPLDPKSDDPTAQTETTERFRNDPEAQAALAHNHCLQDRGSIPPISMRCSTPAAMARCGTWRQTPIRLP